MGAKAVATDTEGLPEAQAKGAKGIASETEGMADLEALRLEGDSMEHGCVDHDIVGVVQHICVEGPTGAGLMHDSPGASRHESCVHLQWTGACTAQHSMHSNLVQQLEGLSNRKLTVQAMIPLIMIVLMGPAKFGAVFVSDGLAYLI